MRVHHPTAEELRGRRDRLLARAGTTREDIERRAEDGTLSAEEYWIWQDIRSVEFLLGDEADLVDHGGS
jgi:hypothetical protein